MKPSEQQLRQWKQEYETYHDVLSTPGWRLLVEEPLNREIDWAKSEINRLVTDRARPDVEEIVELRAYHRALEFLLYQVFQRKELAREAGKVLERRAEALGMKQSPTFEVPKFEEVG